MPFPSEMGTFKMAFVALCMVAAGASADTIGAVSPSSFTVGDVEVFITISGTGLAGSDSTLVTFSGPAGTFPIEPSIASDTSLVVFVPFQVLGTVGTYDVTVLATDSDQTIRSIGPGSLSIVAAPVTGPPLLGVPEDVIAEADGPTGAIVTYVVLAKSIVDPSVNLSCDHASGARYPLDTTIVTCTATDSFGSTSASFPVVVMDTTPPVLTLPADITTNSTVVTWTASAVDAIDGVVPVECDPPSGSTFTAGITTRVTCTATDLRLNTVAGHFDVAVQVLPVLNLPSNITAEATGPTGAHVSYTATTSPGATISCNPPSGALFALGTTTVQCTATNLAGTTSGSFTITVVDTTPPTLVLPNPVVEATGPTGAVVNYVATATDLVDITDPVVCLPLSGSTFALGVTPVQCTSTDAHGNTAHGSFTITVQDTTPPVVTGITATPSLLWPPDHKMVPVSIAVSAFDLVDPNPTSHIASVVSNQPVNGTGDGDTSPDWEIVGPLQLNLRAERQGSSERIYTITVQTSDFSGNVTTSHIVVIVPQSRGRAAR